MSEALNRQMNFHADWVQVHITQCPRCRRRIGGFNRVALGISLIKIQPHQRDLLKRANQQAINVLQHSLRSLPQANFLRQKQSAPSFWKRLAKYTHSISNAAACLLLLLLMRIGIFSGMEKFQSTGEKAIRQHYVLNLGEDLTDDIFPA